MAKTRKPSPRRKAPKKRPPRARRKPDPKPVETSEEGVDEAPEDVEDQGGDEPAIRGITGEATRDAFGRFLPGVSGNPNGRPNSQWIRDFLAEKSEATSEERRRIIIEQLYATAVTRTHKDHVRAAELFLAYSAGKPVQGVEVTGGDGGPVDVDMEVSGMTSEQQNAEWQRLLAKAMGTGATEDEAPEDGDEPEPR